MKNFKNLLTLASMALLFVFTSCESDTTTVTPPDNTVVGVASRTENLSILVQAVNKAGLAATLQNTNNITVFAPTNTAFQNLLVARGYTSLDQFPTAELKEILLNHVIAARVASSQVTTGYQKTLATPAASPNNKMSIYLNTSSGVRINGFSRVTTPDVSASNGVVHIVDAVITLPTVVTFATADPTFSSLAAALTRNDMPNYVGTLSGAGPFTVFAPTNTAFSNLIALFNPATLAGIPTATLKNTLEYHVVSGANVLSSTLTNNQVVNTLLPNKSFTVLLPPARIRDGQNNIANITAVVDVQANNGVIHVLDRVILPAP